MTIAEANGPAAGSDATVAFGSPPSEPAATDGREGLVEAVAHATDLLSSTLAYENTADGDKPTVRVCAACGEQTDQTTCPKDGTPTVVREVLNSDAVLIRVGDLIADRYRVTGVLGRGGFGAVYAAEHTGTQQSVAVKMLLRSATGASDTEVRRFYREAQITAKLKHANTVRVFDVGRTSSGALYIAMELLQGPTLEAMLVERARMGRVMEQSEAVEMATGVLRSLQEAHGQDLVHRDLKPANIMLADSGDDHPVVKVLDFGIARGKDSSLTGAGTALGTPAYMSPEQCAGTAVDGRSDLYSLGVILYRCVVGEPPFVDSNPLSLMFRHVNVQAPDLRTHARTAVSDAFVTLVHRALAKSAGDRYANAREMRLALEEALRTPGSWSSAAKPTATAVVVAGEGESTAVDGATSALDALDTPAVLGSRVADAQGSATQLVSPALQERPTFTSEAASGPTRKPRWFLPAWIGATLAVAGTATWLAGHGTVAGQTAAPAAHAANEAPMAAMPLTTAHLAPAPAPAPSAQSPAQVAGAAVDPSHPAAPAPSAAEAAAVDDATLREASARLASLHGEVEGCVALTRDASGHWDGKVAITVTVGPATALAVRQTGASAEFGNCVRDRIVLAGGFPARPRSFEVSETYAFALSHRPAVGAIKGGAAVPPKHTKPSKPKTEAPVKADKEPDFRSHREFPNSLWSL